jgi:hypothetical protein
MKVTTTTVFAFAYQAIGITAAQDDALGSRRQLFMKRLFITPRSRSCLFSIQLFFAVIAITLLGAVISPDAAWSSDYGDSIADYLNYRPHVTNPDVADNVLNWGKEQGISGMDGVSADEREARRSAVHEFIAANYLSGIVLPNKAPDAGVKVIVGKPNVVMFGPEGNVEDNEGNVAKIGFERFGNYMWPTVFSLRDGKLLVRIYVGAEDDRYNKPHEWFNYLSEDAGKNWRHIACYDKVEMQASQGNERPTTEAAFRLADGEEIRFRPRIIEIDASSIAQQSVNAPGNYYRLGDLPKDKQWFPLFSRKSGEDNWTEGKSYWDSDTLLQGTFAQVGEGANARTVIRLTQIGYPWAGDDSALAQLKDGSLTLTTDAGGWRSMSDLRADGTFSSNSLNYIWRSFDRGRTWKFWNGIPTFSTHWFQNWRAHLEPRFADGSWLAICRTRGIYSGNGPMFIMRSTDQGKTWSEARATRPCSSGIMPGLMLKNGIAVRAYGRPGVFLMFCSDGKGELWGNDVTLIRPWRTQNDALSCNNPHMTVTGPDRFVFVYSKFDMPDPWGQPRLAVVAQEFVVTRK